MARMLDALRRLEATNRFVAPAAPVVEPPDQREAAVESATAKVSATPVVETMVEADEPPFDPALNTWDRQSEGLAYASHAIDQVLDSLDQLADDAAESIAPSHLTQPAAAETPATETPPEAVPETAAEIPAEVAASPLDEFDPSKVIEQHQREQGADVPESSSSQGLNDAPAQGEDALSSMQFAEHWATIALEEFGVSESPAPEAHPAPPENFALPEPAAAPAPATPPVTAPAASVQELPRGEEMQIERSPAEMAALLDLSDETLCTQYSRLGERILTDLTSTTKTCAAFLSIEHQPHVTDVALRTAMALCGAGKQVLVIDAALTDKHLTSGLAMPVEFGLAEVLKGRVPWQQAVRATATRGLCVLPAGRLTPPRLADDDHRLKDVLKELTGQWDLVLLDAGSLAEATARHVAAAARNVYLVVRLGETAVDAAQQAAQALASKEIALRGCVVTNAPN